MNNKYAYCIILFIATHFSFFLYSATPLDVVKIKMPGYSFHIIFHKPWFILAHLTLIELHNDSTHKAIGTFQLPKEFDEEEELPKVSPNKNFLLILNAQWSLFYEENPTTFEWNLFDLNKQKTIKTFPRDAQPKFLTNQTILCKNNYPKFIIPKPTDYFSNVFNTVISWFSSPPKLTAQPAPSYKSTAEKTVQQNPPIPNPTVVVEPLEQSLPQKTSETSTNISSEQIPKINQFNTSKPKNPIAFSKSSSTQPTIITKTTEKALVPYIGQTQRQSDAPKKLFFDVLDKLFFIANQPLTQQSLLVEKYAQTLQKYTPLYNNEIKQLVPINSQLISKKYDDALKLLKEIDILSSSMQTTQDAETEVVNSPAIVNDLIEKVKNLCVIAVSLSLDEQKQLLHKVVVLIKKYQNLYESIIKEMKPKITQPASLQLQASALMKGIENTSIALQNKTVPSLDGIKKITLFAKKLDIIYPQLSLPQQSVIKKKQKEIVALYLPAYKTAIKNNIETGWQQYSSTIVKAAGLTCAAGMTSILVSLVSQNFQILLDPTQTLDTNLLITNASIAVLANIVTQLSEKKISRPISNLLAGGGGTAIAEIAIAPYLQQTAINNYALQAPSFIGPIQAAITWEAFDVISSMIEKQGGINSVIKKMNFKQLLIRPLEQSKNEVTTFLLPKVQTLIKNKQIAFVMTDIGWKVFTASVIGAGMYIAGIEQANGATFLEALYYASLKGTETAFIASLLSHITQQKGAAITLAGAFALPTTNMVNLLLQGTEIVLEPQKIIPEIVKTTAQVAVDYMSEGGFSNAVTTIFTNVKDELKSRWSDAWGIASGFVQTMFATETEEYSGYGGV